MKGKEKTLPANVETVDSTESSAKKPGKLFIVLSYTLALISLIAAFFIPLYDGTMLAKYLLAAISTVLAVFGVTLPDSAYGSFFINAELPTFTGGLIIAVALATVIAIIIFIPVIAGKAKKGTNLRCAFAAEFIAMAATLAFLAVDALLYVGAWYNYSLIISFGVTALVMIAQTIKYNGWLGTTKTITFILALLTFITLYDVAAIIPALQSPLDSLASFGTTEPILLSFIYSFYYMADGSFLHTAQTIELVSNIVYLATTFIVLLSILLDLFWLVCGKKLNKNGAPNTHKGWFVFAAIRYSVIIVLVVASAILSIFLSGYSKISLYYYATAVLVLFAFIVEIARYCAAKSKLKAYNAKQYDLFKNEKLIIKDESLEYVNDGFDQLIEAQQTNMFGDEVAPATQQSEEIVEQQPTQENGEQLSFINSQAEVVEQQPVEEPIVEEVVEQQEVIEQQHEPVVEEQIVEQTSVYTTVEEQPVVEEQPTYTTVEKPVVEEKPVEKQPVAEEQPVQTTPNVNLFGEEIKPEENRINIDPFIDKLTNEERAQFFDVFVNRNRGKIGTIPVYKINGNNTDFFPSVFVHINRVRDLCSDSLISKIYKEICKD